jgi:hypothetical protein
VSEPAPEIRDALPLVSRPLLMGWAVWLLVSWGVNLGIDPPLWHDAHSLIPAVRGFLLAATLGLLLGWPTVRLSLRPSSRPVAQLLTDWALLMLIFQVVAWPLRVLIDWPIAQVVLINLVLGVWSLAAGVWVYLGWTSRGSGGRTAAAGGCIAMVVGGVVVGGVTGWLGAAQWSGLTMMWSLVDEGGPVDAAAMVRRLAVVAAVSGGVWLAAGISRQVRSFTSGA